MSQLKLNAAFTIEVDIEIPLQVHQGKSIFNVPSGELIDSKNNNVLGDLLGPSGDWLEIQPSGTMNLNIRDAFKLENGHNLLATITGRSVPNEVVVPKMENGSLVSGDEMYFVHSLLMETDSEKYNWVNDRVFLGQMTELTMPSEVPTRISYDVFVIGYEAHGDGQGAVGNRVTHHV